VRLTGIGRRYEGEDNPVRNLVSKLRASSARRDDGASAVEYGLLVALIAVIIAGTVLILGNALSSKFKSACEAVSQPSTCAPAGH
jgi:pilus assembly protein Flp/PilA